VLVFLTPAGAARLFPHSGADIVDDSPDLGDLMGDGEVMRLRAAAAAAPDAAALGGEIDAWLRARLDRTAAPSHLPRLAAATDMLRDAVRPVASVAEAVDLSPRQLERIFHDAFGLSPKQFQRIHRLQLSVYASVTGRGDPLDGFADQTHQIRDWRSHLGTTPGAMRRGGLTPVAAHFLSEEARRPLSFAHYL
jgi:AraC-like DNA-binding protein